MSCALEQPEMLRSHDYKPKCHAQKQCAPTVSVEHKLKTKLNQNFKITLMAEEFHFHSNLLLYPKFLISSICKIGTFKSYKPSIKFYFTGKSDSGLWGKCWGKVEK